MWFWLSLIAILCWSGSDILSKAGSAPEDVNSHWKMVMSVGFIMGIHATIEVIRGVPFGLKDILIYLPVSFLYIFAMVLGYVGLRYVVLFGFHAYMQFIRRGSGSSMFYFPWTEDVKHAAYRSLLHIVRNLHAVSL